MEEQRVIDIIIDRLQNQFQSILDRDPTIYKGYTLVLTNERQFIKSKDIKPKCIYVVVKFLQGSRDFNQHRQPISLNALGEHNSLEVCQKLMMDFAEEYNLYFDFDQTGYVLKETLSTVSSLNNFNEVFNGYRSLFYITGTFFIGIKSNPIEKITVHYDGTEENGEEIDFISAQFSFNAQTDSQPFFTTNNFTRTINKIASFSLGFSMYAIESGFYINAMDTVFNKNNEVNIDKKYTIEVKLKGNENPYRVEMRLVSVSGVQELREFPATSFTFAR